MYVLIRVKVNPAVIESGDSIEVENELVPSLEEAQQKMRRELDELISKYSKEIVENGILDEEEIEDGKILEECDGFGFGDYKCLENSAWLAWPFPRKWQIIKVS